MNNSHRNSDALPPHDEEAERAVLGCLLLDPSLLSEAARRLEPAAFYGMKQRIVWQAMFELDRAGSAVDIITVQSRLKDAGKLESVGGMAHLAELPDKVPSAANLEYYLAIILSKHAQRVAITTQAEINEAIAANPDLLPSILKRGARALDECAGRLSGASADALSLRAPAELLEMTFSDADNYLGDRILAAGQPLVIAGAGGVGKSRLALQLAVASIVGRPWLGLETHAIGKRWLILQRENSNRRLNHDLGLLREWVGDAAWADVDAHLRIHTVETDADSWLCLESAEVRARIIRTLDAWKPDIMILDALYDFSDGDLNKDPDMRSVCSWIGRLTKHDDPERACLVLHHAQTGKAGAAKATGYERSSFGRNSKVLHSWARAQINLAPGSAEDNALLVVSCGKCSNGREFSPFAVRLNPATMIYEVERSFDWEKWQSEVSGTGRASDAITPETVKELCEGSPEKAALAKRIMAETGCGRSGAYKAIKRAECRKTIHYSKATRTYARSSR